MQKENNQISAGVIAGYAISGAVIFACLITLIVMVVTSRTSKDNELISRKAVTVTSNSTMTTYVSDYDLGSIKVSREEYQKKTDKPGKGKDAVNNPNGYIIEKSATELLTESDLDGYSPRELTLAKAEIVARHGAAFSEKEFIDYFSSKSWYSMTPNGQLSPIETSNFKLIEKYQESHKKSYLGF
ncbi:YARHG domain-containing protein [Lachnobacterium bovis]|uniref:YARHG domain-containing protein n=1 Tax=Lachnobacterium bovis TaxID=140626 RepID=A0A1H9P4Y7_9FIRM|nr:YARHG domain-containing protein [Lachnobacterium bovis]SER42945.1 YARHG domain-containing protein [Lachnobacterium bovis]